MGPDQCVCLPAGKVHGSLARAGKVRGQTPKVPPQEKKKKPTGRAMKRIKYNRRFVNVGAWLQAAGGPGGATEHKDQRAAAAAAGGCFPSCHACCLPLALMCMATHSYVALRAGCLPVCAVVGFGKKRGPNSQ